MECLRLHDWPGNVRELQNLVERAVIMSTGPELRLPPHEFKPLVKSKTPSAAQTLADFEKEHWEAESFPVDEKWLSRQAGDPEQKNQPKLSHELEAHEKALIEAALRQSRGRVYGPSGAAAKLGIPRSTLESKICSLKINKYRFKA